MPYLIIELIVSVPNYCSLETGKEKNSFETFFKRRIVFEIIAFTDYNKTPCTAGDSESRWLNSNKLFVDHRRVDVRASTHAIHLNFSRFLCYQFHSLSLPSKLAPEMARARYGGSGIPPEFQRNTLSFKSAGSRFAIWRIRGLFIRDANPEHPAVVHFWCPSVDTGKDEGWYVWILFVMNIYSNAWLHSLASILSSFEVCRTRELCSNHRIPPHHLRLRVHFSTFSDIWIEICFVCKILYFTFPVSPLYSFVLFIYSNVNLKQIRKYVHWFKTLYTERATQERLEVEIFSKRLIVSKRKCFRRRLERHLKIKFVSLSEK